ncbi:hypothetical protein SDC9_132516 [bioreactor metagenome]|uniref:Cobalt-zinc-cadmium resistance protein CzcC n=1 Tax=bioreactor metagenome TaxID=1076179 RepID=A0A645D897_9ZZZZ
MPTAFNIDKTTLTFGSDQNNIAENNYPLKVWGVQQNFNFPTLYLSELKAKEIEITNAELELLIQTEKIIKEVSETYIELQILINKLEIFKEIDSLYTKIFTDTEKKYNKGDATNLDLLNIKAKKQQAKQQLDDVKYKIDNYYQKLKTFVGNDTDFTISKELKTLNLNEKNIEESNVYKLLNSQNNLNENIIKIEKDKLLPDVSFNYFIGTNFLEHAKYYHGFEVGIAIPLFFNSQKAKIKAAEIAMEANQQIAEYEIQLLKTKQKELKKYIIKYKDKIDYHNATGKELYEEIIRTSSISYEKGEIDFFKFANSLEVALQIKIDYFDNILIYNNLIFSLIYISI